MQRGNSVRVLLKAMVSIKKRVCLFFFCSFMHHFSPDGTIKC